MVLPHEHWMNLEEYHEIERNSDIKYEYSNGRTYAISGCTFAHSQIAINLVSALNAHLRGKVCRVANSDMHVLPLGDENPTYLPDITVTCNPEDYQDESTAIRSPHLIIEVLSPSTESYDRGRKFQHYRMLESLQEYLLIAQDGFRIEHYVRQINGQWLLADVSKPDASLELTSIGCTLLMTDVYEKVSFQGETSGPETPLHPLR